MILGTEYFFCEMVLERPAIYGYQMEIHCKYKQFVIITKKNNEKVLKYFIPPLIVTIFYNVKTISENHIKHFYK